MPKDPAYLYYYRDFMAATAVWDDDEVGAYQRALNYQADTGHICKKDFFKIVGTHRERILPKFEKDSQGRYYNERLDQVLKLRKNYTEYQREKAQKRWGKTDKPLSGKQLNVMPGNMPEYMPKSCMRVGNGTVNRDVNGTVNRDVNETVNRDVNETSLYDRFKKAYPNNGSFLNPEVSNWFMIGEAGEFVINAALQYDKFCRAAYKETYPHSQYIMQAINWLRQAQYAIDWDARLKAFNSSHGEPKQLTREDLHDQ